MLSLRPRRSLLLIVAALAALSTGACTSSTEPTPRISAPTSCPDCSHVITHPVHL